MSEVVERFLRYIAFDTQSKDGEDEIPSTKSQLALADLLAEELREMGASGVRRDRHGYVYAWLPATPGAEEVPAIGFIAHMDTSPAFSGRDIRPRFVENYQGGDICLNREQGIWLRETEFPQLGDCRGKTLITTDGTTLLGADDKAGVAEIMTMISWLTAHPQTAHGRICVAFTPDEEVGRGADLFDVEGFGAQAAYTVDGGALGELEYENFNAASAAVTVHGVSIHPGSAKGAMKNALLVGMELQSLLPVFENPMYTEGYEGFFHLESMSGSVEEATLSYIIRDHDRTAFEKKKRLFSQAAAFLNEKYGEGTLEVQIRDSYYNMREMLASHMDLIDRAKDAMKRLGIEPLVRPIRGGTDGARLSYLGLPCPNLCAGGYNFHGKYEFVPVESMEQIAKLLQELACSFAA